MGKNKSIIGYMLILVGVFGLLKMVLGYTDPSFTRAALFIGGIVALGVGIYKEKQKPRYLES